MGGWTRRAVLGALPLGVVGCGGGGDDEPLPLAFERISQPWMQTTRQESYVIRTQAEWERVWALHQPPTFAPAPPPAVDFNQFMVLGLSLGTGPNGCYGLSIRAVLATPDQTLVEYRLTEPGPSSACTLATVALTDFVRLPRRDGSVAFRRVSS